MDGNLKKKKKKSDAGPVLLALKTSVLIDLMATYR